MKQIKITVFIFSFLICFNGVYAVNPKEASFWTTGIGLLPSSAVPVLTFGAGAFGAYRGYNSTHDPEWSELETKVRDKKVCSAYLDKTNMVRVIDPEASVIDSAVTIMKQSWIGRFLLKSYGNSVCYEDAKKLYKRYTTFKKLQRGTLLGLGTATTAFLFSWIYSPAGARWIAASILGRYVHTNTPSCMITPQQARDLYPGSVRSNYPYISALDYCRTGLQDTINAQALLQKIDPAENKEEIKRAESLYGLFYKAATLLKDSSQLQKEEQHYSWNMREHAERARMNAETEQRRAAAARDIAAVGIAWQNRDSADVSVRL